MINVSPTLSKFDFLRMAESRLKAVLMYNSESSEIQRLEFVVDDLKSKLTKTELDEYNVRKNAVATAAEVEASRVAMLKAMNENRDKPSI